jgi:Protein of unknown function (DUF1524)
MARIPHDGGVRAPRTHLIVLTLLTAGCVSIPTAPAETTSPEAAAQLSQLTVARGGSMRGYSRERFPHWREAGPNCNVRDKVLERDGTQVRRRGCNVVAGRWFSPYDRRTVTDPSDVDIDHLVPLANAWRSGASEWDDDRRSDFANDLTRPELRAVTATANRAKGDQDPSQWKPASRDAWCDYARDWIAVKHHWRLSVTTAEKSALTRMLETCPWPTSRPPTSSPVPAG